MNWRLRAAFLCTGVVLLAAVAGASEFENLRNADLRPPGSLAGGDATVWSKKRIIAPHSLAFVDVEGVNAARFEIRPDDRKVSDGYRAELRDPYIAAPGEEVWYRFRTLIPRDFPFHRRHSVVLAQWHDRKVKGQPAQRPQLALRLVDGSLRLTLWNDAVFAAQGERGDGLFVYETRDFPRGEWLDMRYRVKWSPGDDGLAQVWINGRQVTDYRGPIGYKADVYGPYFKLGIYTVHEFDEPFYVYHTDFGRAASAATLVK